MDLARIGWDDAWAQAFAPWAREGCVPARVVEEHRGGYLAVAARGARAAVCSGRLEHEARRRADLPAVGDWVALDAEADREPVPIRAVLPRRSAFTRVPPCEPDNAQCVAANLDRAFVVSALDESFNLRRIERFCAAAYASGAEPAVLLNKSDLSRRSRHRRDEVAAAVPGVPVLLTSATEGRGLEALRDLLPAGSTAAFLGASGVGKSTLVNALAGEDLLDTQEVRAGDAKGRHTTTARQMLLLPGGALVVDTPGMRELQLHEVSLADLAALFSDLMALAADCRFRDCRHSVEPGCAVRAAIAEGRLPASRLASYDKLRAEVRAAAQPRSGRRR